MERESESDNPDAQVEAPRENRWVRFVGYIKRKVNERKAKKQNETPTDKAARRTAVATIWMAIFTFVLASTSGFTIWILKNQLTEMHEGGIDTHVLAEAAEDGAGAASDQADAAQQFSDTAEDINGRMSDAVDQLQATADNTKTTIRNAEKSFRDEQRAWVGVEQVIPKDFSETVPWTVTVVFFNSGRTPARNVQISAMFKTSPIPLTGPPPEDIKKLQFRPTQSIAPQGRYFEFIGRVIPAEPYTPFQMQGFQQLIPQYQLIKNKTILLYYFGIFKYDDVFGNHRETQYCILLANPDTKEAGFCDAFNDLN